MTEKINGFVEKNLNEYFIVEVNEVTGKTSINIDCAPTDSIEHGINEVLSMRVNNETLIKEYLNYDYGIENDTYNQIEYSVKLGCFVYCNGYTLEENYNTLKAMYDSIVKESQYGYWSAEELQNCIFTPYIEIRIVEPIDEIPSQYDTLTEKYL